MLPTPSGPLVWRAEGVECSAGRHDRGVGVGVGVATEAGDHSVGCHHDGDGGPVRPDPGRDDDEAEVLDRIGRSLECRARHL